MEKVPVLNIDEFIEDGARIFQSTDLMNHRLSLS